jgi:hypothetical protein
MVTNGRDPRHWDQMAANNFLKEVSELLAIGKRHVERRITLRRSHLASPLLGSGSG